MSPLRFLIATGECRNFWILISSDVHIQPIKSSGPLQNRSKFIFFGIYASSLHLSLCSLELCSCFSSAAHPSKSSPNVPVDGSTKEKPCGIVGEMVVSSAPAKYQVAVRQRSQTVAETIASSRAAAKRQIFVKHTSSQSDFGVPIESWEVEPAGCDSFELIWPNLSPT